MIFSSLSCLTSFSLWMGYVYILSSLHLSLVSFLYIFLTAVVIAYQVTGAHIWHLVSTFLSIPLEYVPFISKHLIVLSNRILQQGFKITSVPLEDWETIEKVYCGQKTLALNFLDITPDFIWAKNANGEYVYVNEKVCDELLLTPCEDVIGRTTLEISNTLTERGISHTFGEICSNSDHITLKNKQPTFFYEYGIANNKLLVLRVLKAPVFDDNYTIKGMIAVGRDISLHKQTYDKLEFLLSHKKYEEAEKVFLEYKKIFDSMENINNPHKFPKGLQ